MKWRCTACNTGTKFEIVGEIRKELEFDENGKVISEKVVDDNSVLRCCFCGNETRSKLIKVIAKVED